MIVEDDAPTSAYLADNLHADDYGVICTATARQALSLLEVKRCDLMLLDVVLPDLSGYEFCRQLRDADGLSGRVDPGLPIIMLSGRTSEADRVRGLSRGADDYVCKPFHYPELILRINAVLRRSCDRRRRGAVRIADLTIDPSSREVLLGPRRVNISAREFELLRVLAAEPTRVFTKQELLREIWGYELMGATRTLDSHACRLRRKLRPSGRRWVVSVWGVGYRLTDHLDEHPTARIDAHAGVANARP